MRRTTTFLTTFCSVAVIVACGKRGDPLPPLRPVPDAAESVAIAQVGDRIVLSWRAPVRNTDGTVEKLELDTVVVVRRVIDIDALVEAQTTYPSAAPTAVSGETEPGSAAPGAAADPGTEAAAAAESTEPTGEPAAAPPESAGTETGSSAPSAPAEGVTQPAPGAAPAPAAAPALVIPPFPGDAPFVTTMAAAVPGAPLEYEDPIDPSWYGKRIEYAVAHVNRRGRQSPYGKTVAIEPVEPLPTPTGVSVSSADGFVAISWEETEEATSRAPDRVGYVVYRRPEGSDAPVALNPGAPRLRASFEDRNAPFGQSICYEVRARLVRPPPVAPSPSPPTAPTAPTAPGQPAAPGAAAPPGEPAPATGAVPPTEPPASAAPDVAPGAEEPTPASASQPNPAAGGAIEPLGPRIPVPPRISNPFIVSSEASPEECLTPTDTFAPATPEDLVAVSSPSGVLLTWRLVSTPDLGGYRVYRASRREGPFELIGETTVASFTDSEAAPGETFFYMVTSVDTSPRENESERSEVVDATRP